MVIRTQDGRSLEVRDCQDSFTSTDGETVFIGNTMEQLISAVSSRYVVLADVREEPGVIVDTTLDSVPRTFETHCKPISRDAQYIADYYGMPFCDLKTEQINSLVANVLQRSKLLNELSNLVRTNA